MKKNILPLFIATTMSLCAPSAHAFDIVQFFKDLFGSVPIAGSRAPKEEKKEETNFNKEVGDKGGSVKDRNSGETKKDVSEVTSINKNLYDEKRCFPHYPLGPPRFKDPDTKTQLVYLCKKGFAIGYNVDYKNPMWVAEHLQNKNFVSKKELVQYSFDYDPQIPKKNQTNGNAYKAAGFDRGQLFAPENILNSEEDRQEGFLLTNVAPQVGINFNRGIWSDLEIWLRQQTRFRGAVYVVTGPLYLGKTQRLDDGTMIPSHYFKTVVDYKMSESIAFIIPNKQIITDNNRGAVAGNAKYPQTTAAQAYNCSDKGKTTCGIFDFSTSIREVERLSGFNLISGISENHVLKIKVSEDFVKSKRYTQLATY